MSQTSSGGELREGVDRLFCRLWPRLGRWRPAFLRRLRHIGGEPSRVENPRPSEIVVSRIHFIAHSDLNRLVHLALQ